jgi:uncharacterized protein
VKRAMNTGEPLHSNTVDGTSTSPQQRSQAALSHALALCGLVIPFINIIAPLIIWVNDKGPGTFVKDHARESLNFQITMMIGFLVFGTMSVFLIGLPFLCIQYIFVIVVTIKATMAANDGKTYLYPLTIRMLNS